MYAKLTLIIFYSYVVVSCCYLFMINLCYSFEIKKELERNSNQQKEILNSKKNIETKINK